MIQLLFNPVPLMLSLATMFGLLLHDTQIDRATTIVPARIASVSALESELKTNDQHIHAERVSVSENLGQLGNSQPRVQPRNENDKKYVTQKKVTANSFGSVYSWPSI
jgi:hypothetical protein